MFGASWGSDNPVFKKKITVMQEFKAMGTLERTGEFGLRWTRIVSCQVLKPCQLWRPQLPSRELAGQTFSFLWRYFYLCHMLICSIQSNIQSIHISEVIIIFFKEGNLFQFYHLIKSNSPVLFCIQLLHFIKGLSRLSLPPPGRHPLPLET